MRPDRVLAAQLEGLSAEFAGAGAEQGDEADLDRVIAVIARDRVT